MNFSLWRSSKNLVLIICIIVWTLILHLWHSICKSPSYVQGPSVLFVKTHKTGSSTVTGILWRELCLKQLVNCFLPPADHPGRMWDLTNSAHIQYIKSGSGTGGVSAPYNAWLSHIVYNKRIFDFLTTPTTVISIVRRPSLRFQSAWYWYNLSAVIGGRSLTSFAESLVHGNATSLLSKLEQHTKIRGKFRAGLDSYSQELTGVEKLKVLKVEFQAKFAALLQKIESLEWFIIVNERMEESLVLLAHHLEWSQDSLGESLLHLRLKQQQYMSVTDDHLLHKLDEAQPHDSALYVAANQALDHRISMLELAEKESFRDQVQQLQATLVKLHTDCDANGSNDDSRCHELRKDNKQAIQEFYETSKSMR